jgi:hypothetical protein
MAMSLSPLGSNLATSSTPPPPSQGADIGSPAPTSAMISAPSPPPPTTQDEEDGKMVHVNISQTTEAVLADWFEENPRLYNKNVSSYSLP